MFDVIVAMTKNFGIGRNGCMAWRCLPELKLFKEKTLGHVLIMGRKTIVSLPELPDRTILGITRSRVDYINRKLAFHDIMDAVEYAKEHYPNKKIFIAGGGQIYDKVFRKYKHHIDTLHLSIMEEDYECDTFVYSLKLNDWIIQDEIEHEKFKHYALTQTTYGERQYLNVIEDVYRQRLERQGRNAITSSLFVQHMKFDLSDGFPLLTTKKMFFRGIIEELLFFLRGETDSKILEEKKVNIWKGNTTREFLDNNGFEKRKEGMLGPMYGYQWRQFNAEYDEETGHAKGPGVDQLKDVITLIKNDPHSRRILMTDYNPAQSRDGVLYPCHSIILQFYVRDEYLDVFCYNRSSDLFLGVPFNITSTSLLIYIICNMTNKKPGFLNLTLGDAHIYNNHYEQVARQLNRIPYKFPTLTINKQISLENIPELTTKDFTLNGYKSHRGIKAEMVA